MKAIGIDGCKLGWVAASYDSGDVLIFKTINDVIAHYKDDYIILIDMPIGLASTKNKIRTCEKEARRALPAKKKSSVFPVPCREVLSADSYADANEINKKVVNCGISKQSWFIMHKIKEVDDLLIDNPDLRPKIKESHPEIAFQFLNDGHYLINNKKSAEGIAERLTILMKHNDKTEALYNKALLDNKRKDVAKDDILDALCLAVTLDILLSQPDNFAERLFSANQITDEHGIEMAIYHSQGKIN